MNGSVSDRKPSIWRTALYVAIVAAAANMSVAASFVTFVHLRLPSSTFLRTAVVSGSLVLVALLTALLTQTDPRTSVALVAAFLCGYMAEILGRQTLLPDVAKLVSAKNHAGVFCYVMADSGIQFGGTVYLFAKLSRHALPSRLVGVLAAGILLRSIGWAYWLGLGMSPFSSLPAQIVGQTVSLFYRCIVGVGFFGPIHAVIARMLLWAADTPRSASPTPQTPPPARGR